MNAKANANVSRAHAGGPPGRSRGVMNRRQLTFVVLVNALVSVMIALLVVWIVEWRRPDPEELAALAPVFAQRIEPDQQDLGVQAAPVPDEAADDPADADAVEEPLAGEAVETLPTATSAPPTPLAEQTTYTVRAGDFLSAIAERYGIAVDDLVDINGIDNPNNLFVGQELTLPISAGAVATVDARPAAPTSTPPPTEEPPEPAPTERPSEADDASPQADDEG